MTTTKKALIFFGALVIVIWSALFGIIHSTRGTSSKDMSKDIDDLRTSLTALDANVRILTETLTKYEEELKLCRARPFCQDPVAPAINNIEKLEKFDVPEHLATDEVDHANP